MMKNIHNYALSVAYGGWIIGLALVLIADAAFLLRNNFATSDIIFTSIITAFYLGMSYCIYRFMIKPNHQFLVSYIEWLNSPLWKK